MCTKRVNLFKADSKSLCLDRLIIDKIMYSKITLKVIRRKWYQNQIKQQLEVSRNSKYGNDCILRYRRNRFKPMWQEHIYCILDLAAIEYV